MRYMPTRQRELGLDTEEQIPRDPSVREECKELLRQLLRIVVREEANHEGAGNE
jgi:hypothetical protein